MLVEEMENLVEDRKKCYICNKIKNIKNFYRDKDRRDGREYVCIDCRRIKDSLWRKNNKEKISLRSKKYYLNNIKKELKRSKARRKYIKSQPHLIEKYRARERVLSKTPKGRFNSYKKNARRRCLEFKLTFKECENIFNNLCFYCGDNLSNGIDRVNSKIGYLSGNVVPCCKQCNWIKSCYSMSEFVNHCKKIASRFPNQVEI